MVITDAHTERQDAEILIFELKEPARRIPSKSEFLNNIPEILQFLSCMSNNKIIDRTQRIIYLSVCLKQVMRSNF